MITNKADHTLRVAMDSRGDSCKRLKRAARGSRLGLQKRQQVDQSKSKISFRCKNILAARSVPLLFILVCFLVIANTRCDQAGGANAGETATNEQSGASSSSNGNIDSSVDKLKTSDLNSLSASDLEAIEQQAIALKNRQHQKSPARKMDPLNILREIYLDSNSKIITMLMPESETENGLDVVTLNPLLITYDTFKRHNIVAKSTVQKFHPNGRYGRRSVDNFAEPHVELGRLIYNEGQENESQQAPVANGARQASLRAILKGIGRGNLALDPHLSAVAMAHARGVPTKYQPSSSGSPTGLHDSGISNSAQVGNYQLEMNKLLKCNFTGISNLYWCDGASSN